MGVGGVEEGGGGGGRIGACVHHGLQKSNQGVYAGRGEG